MAGTGSSKAVDPIAYRPEEQGNIRTEPVTEKTQDWTFDPRKLKNADVNLGAYGDDSSETNYNNPGLWGGENAKYKGENTKNTTVQYNPYATVEGLNPDYAYGQKAQMVNSDNAGYIQRRNDEIASALYNAGRVSEEDVRQYLMGQKGFMNSTENERENTIKSVWKRLGEISSNRTPAENKSNGEEGLNNIRNDLLKNTGGEIYGKTTADWRGSDRAIKTLQDANSIEAKVAESRIKNFENLQTMDSQAIAASIVSGYTPYGDQGMRDLQKYDPIKYADVQMYVKKLQGQKAVNSISMGNGLDLTSDSDTAEENIQNEKERFAEENSTSLEEKQEILKDVDESLASNQSAQTAEGTMNNIQADINKLKTRLKNLDKEASTLFKGDVPQYIVNAYKSNRTKEIQDKISELESTYNAAYDRYKTQLDNEWKQKEYDLKERQYNRDYALSVRKLNLEEQSQTLNAYKTQQEILINKQKLRDGNFFTDKNGNTWEKVTDEDGNTIIRAVPVLKTYEGTGMTGKGQKYNNPGNIKDMSFGNPIGNEGGFAIFATPEDGFDALVEKVKYNQTNPNSKYYGTNLLQYFQIYSPKEDGNDPEGRAKRAAAALGVTIDTPIKDIDTLEFAKYIAKSDSGYDYSTYGQFRGKDVSGDNYNWKDSMILANLAEQFTDNGKLGPKEYETIDKIIGGDNPRREWNNYYNDYINDLYGNQTELIPRADGNKKLFKILSEDKDDTPIAFKQRIYNLVPGTLKNSENELKNLYGIAKDLMKQGYTADEASLIFFGIDLSKDKTGMGYPLVMAAKQAPKLPDTFYGNLASYLDNGETSKAISLVDNTVLSNESQLITDTISFVDKLNDLEDAIDEASAYLGPVSGWVNKKITDLFGNKKYANATAKMRQAFAQLENQLMGSNITEGEGKRYEGMIPQTTDKVSTIKEKIKAAKETALIDLNAARKKYSLPALDEKTLSNADAKIELYKNILGTNSNYDVQSNGGTGEIELDLDGGDTNDEYDFDLE